MFGFSIDCGTLSLDCRKKYSVRTEETTLVEIPKVINAELNFHWILLFTIRSYTIPKIYLGISSPRYPDKSSAKVISRTLSFGFGVMVDIYPLLAMLMAVDAVS